MALVRTVHPCEALVNGIATLRDKAPAGLRDSKVGLGIGFAFAALAGAPMPLPQIALAGPIVATLAMGALGGRTAAAVGFVSYLALQRPTPGVALAAAAVAALVGWVVPMLLTKVEKLDGATSAITLECDGFASLDLAYGEGASLHVFSLLRRALETETRDSDLVVHVEDKELVLVLDGSNPAVARSVMARVERRFAAWLSDAGYDCDLSVGLTSPEDHDSLLRAARTENGFYLD